ncbi:M20 aminoacylase family protein [Aestuariicoccus sp. MJ-SS9]|uniref:M20 aminoacylase family protein n=1 Tax=Aestuariicoccus sp. MJ-SS9 TaxID=3079855 RepID=UPI002909A80D|nr:M20 aminoacylase family protein [Aestuariicoccus sp. MJ-SS9]MDU8913768.1 M20 aminoacylase family protein [Aestuariicoccus sp. MJ-SS9]
MPARNSFAELHAEIADWRRDIHAHPELRFEEHRTAAKVADLLTGFGCDEVVTGIGRTGVVGVIHGNARGSGKVIGFRADMDALPIAEATGAPHASTHPGVMHACGHDGHTAMLLGAAKYLAETRNFDGSVVLIFQPAEEGSGGARAMIEDGLMTRWGIQEVYGMHNWPGLPIGRFAVRDGPQMAATASFELSIKGRGGHAALPHKAVDTTLAAAHVVVALQSIAARNIDPLKTVVVSTCGMRSDTDAFNVIPDEVMLRGTVRYFDPDVHEIVRKRLSEIATLTAQAHGAVAHLDYTPRVPPTINDPEAAARAAEAAQAVSGDVIRDFDPVMPGEDFSEMLAQRPGAYLFIGNGDSADLHNPAYEFNDELIPLGCSWYVEMAETRMPLG